MAPITVSARSGAPEETAADTRVVGVFEDEKLTDPALQRLIDLGEAKRALKKVALAHEDAPGGGQRRVLIAGLGKRDEFGAEQARVAAAAAAARAKELGAVSLSWAAPQGEAIAGALVEGTLLKLYSFDRFKSKSGDNDNGGVESLEIAGDSVDAEEVERGRIASVAANAARDLQNLPSNVATPGFLAERAREIADEHEALELELLDREAIVERGMGAFASVAQGSHTEPRLIVLRYRPSGASGPHLAFVGKPGDIVTAMNGTTIEVNNTDAEGRLILADSLCYAVEQGAERIVDLATLTGAILVALGHTYCGLFSNDDDWCGEVGAAGDASGEIGWRLPLHPEYYDLTKGQYADLTNAAEQRVAMSSYAAEFLRQFVDESPWVHIDIAGTAWGLNRNYVAKGASGFGTRLLIELARRSAA